MADLEAQNKRTKPKQKVDPNKMDPKEMPQGDTTSGIGEKNVVGVQGRDGSDTHYDVEDEQPAPFVP